MKVKLKKIQKPQYLQTLSLICRICVCFSRSLKKFVTKGNQLPEFDWLIETNSFLIGDFILIVDIDWTENKQLDVNVYQSFL